MRLRSTRRRFAVVLLAGLAALPLLAQAELFKCKDANGATTYRDTQCAQLERREPADTVTRSNPAREATVPPKKGAPMLWETTSKMNPRAASAKPLTAKELEEAGDYKYMLGVPLKTRECRTSSPIELRLATWSGQCDRQIRAGGGTCTVTQTVSTMSDPRASTNVITGDYRNELHVVTRITQATDGKGQPVVDEAESHLRFIGPCPAGMKEGERFLVNADGTLRPMR